MAFTPAKFDAKPIDYSWLGNLPGAYQQSQLNSAKIQQAQYINSQNQRQQALQQGLSSLDPNDPAYIQKMVGVLRGIGNPEQVLSTLPQIQFEKLQQPYGGGEGLVPVTKQIGGQGNVGSMIMPGDTAPGPMQAGPPQQQAAPVQAGQDTGNQTGVPGVSGISGLNPQGGQSPGQPAGQQPSFGSGVSPKDGRTLPPLNPNSILDQTVAGMETGAIPPDITGIAGRTPGFGPAVIGKLASRDFDYSKAKLQWQGAQDDVKALNNSQFVKYSGAINSVVNTIDRVKSWANSLQQGGMQDWNKAKLEWYERFKGNTPQGQLATNYLTDIRALTTEMATAESGGYAPHENAWDLAKAQVNGNFGVKQINGNLGEIQRILRYRFDAIPNAGTLGPSAANRYTGNPGGNRLVPNIERGSAQETDLLNRARKAIQQRAPADDVNQRLLDLGVQPGFKL